MLSRYSDTIIINLFTHFNCTIMRKVKIEQSEFGGYNVYIDGRDDHKVFRGSLMRLDDTPRPKWYTDEDSDDYNEPDKWFELGIEWIAGCFLKKSTITHHCGCCHGTVYEGIIVDEETFYNQIESEL